MTVRKYWQRHPVQLRIMAFVLLILVPILLPVGCLIFYWREILDAFADQYREAWSVLVRGE